MVGVNKILMNKATLLAAINHYFKDVVYQDGQVPIATNVAEEHSPDYGTFAVTTETKLEE